MADNELRPRGLGEITIGELDLSHRKMVDDITRRMPQEYAALIDKESSLLSLVRLSEALVENKRMKKSEMEKVDIVARDCGLQFREMQRDVMIAQEHAQGSMRKARKGLGGQGMAEGIVKIGSRTNGARLGNVKLELGVFAPFAGNEGELGRLANAMKAAYFYEMRSPTSRKEFNPSDACALFIDAFPNGDEREPWKRGAMARVQEMANRDRDPKLAKKHGLSWFHAMTAVNNGQVVGYTQWTTMPLGNGDSLVFWQYGCAANKGFMLERYGRDETFREKGIGSAFYVLRHGISAAAAKNMGYTGNLVGTICEAEYIGQAFSDDDIRFTKTRLHIHRQMGAKAMILEMEDGSWVTAHLQPKMSPTSNPIRLNMMFRPVKFDESEGKKTTEIPKAQAQAMVMSYIDNFNREGFPDEDVDWARQILKKDFARAVKVLLVAPEDLPNIVEMARMDPLLKEQLERDLKENVETMLKERVKALKKETGRKVPKEQVRELKAKLVEEYGTPEAHERRIKAALSAVREQDSVLGS